MPSFVVEDIPFKTKWEEACNLCSKSFIELLIGNNKKSMDKLDSEIESTRKKLFETLTSAEMETLNKDIENQFVIWEKEVKDIKMRKFQRDLQDFNDGTVYRWQQTTSRSRNITRSSSLSSVSSREEEGGVRTGTRLYNLRHNSNRRRGNNYKRKDKYMDSPSTSKLQVINLSDVVLTEPQIEVLSLGLSFSPTASFDLFSVMKDLNLFARKLVLKKLHEKSNFGEEWTEQELETINILEDLSNEQDTSGTEQDLLAFLDILNDNEINVRLTCKYSQTSVEFLDVLVNRGMNDQIETNVHRKETAVNSLLHASSSHPKPLINGIPTGQFLRIKRICSNNDSFKAQAEALSTRFVNRGYSKRCIKRGWKKANSTRREDLLQPRIKSQVDSKVRFISTYSDKWPNVKQALNKYWPMLTTDRTLTKYLSEQPSITYRRSHNLKDLLVHSYHTGQTPGKTFG
ncbi:unnamed protein product [Ranitomeya imitator]|uniref:Helix-turn-helix domain-containing protein n=1 Tax=Ranitomeya imitator TaxID=111125 RepID=A0ABN9LLB3_9NEOB|nr:unnamed protein product [Ranitomeya imitator]